MTNEDHGPWIVQVDADGWLTLPPAALRRLGICEGGVVEIELLDGGTIAIRPAERMD
jgi:bifunctional DNA-binding transcriptional regulator/antitoxin component of YhaV-PrlF toxin-antitoxin module